MILKNTTNCPVPKQKSHQKRALQCVNNYSEAERIQVSIPLESPNVGRLGPVWSPLNGHLPGQNPPKTLLKTQPNAQCSGNNPSKTRKYDTQIGKGA